MKRYTTSERLNQLMRERSLRQVDLLDAIRPYSEKYNIKLSKSALSQYVSGKVEPKQDKLFLMGRALGVSEAWLMGFDDYVFGESQEDTTQLPVYSSIACGQPCLVQEDVTGYEITPVSWLKGGDYFYIVAKGDSMTGARISEGDLLLIRRQPEVDEGDIAAVVVNGECTLKRVYRTNGSLVLQSENPKYPPIILKEGEVRILGKLKRITTKV